MQSIIRAITTVFLTTLILSTPAWADPAETAAQETCGGCCEPLTGPTADGEVAAADGEAAAADEAVAATDGEAAAADCDELAADTKKTAAAGKETAAAAEQQPESQPELKQPVIYVPPNRGNTQARVGGSTRGGDHPL